MPTHIIDSRDLKAQSHNEIVQLKGISKSFGGVKALTDVDLTLRRGVIHGLVGENGAGKSTLIKIICGIEQPDAGMMWLDHKPYTPARPSDAIKSGIQVVHQELNLLTLMSVADNVCFEYLPRGKFGIIRRQEQYAQAREALKRVGLETLDLTCPIEQLGIAHQQLIEIARALKSQSRLLILDEPTATLTAVEAANLFRLLHELAAKGVAILLVSHHLDEIMLHCDEVTIMRNGHTISTYPIEEASIDRLIGDMISKQDNGEKNHDREVMKALKAMPRTPKAGKKPILALQSLRTTASPWSQGVSFSLQEGEILGIAGLVGAGRTELLRAITGADKPASGHLLLAGEKRTYTSPAQSMHDGIAFVTEDRRHEGLILPMSIACNITLASTAEISHGGIISQARERQIALAQAAALGLKYGDLQDSAATLSGGNQQKIVLAKWLARDPAILLMDEPTRGVDVGAKAEIYALIHKLAAQGKAILLVSSEMRELMTLCDRILVMAQHRLVGEVAAEDFSQQRILQLAYQQAI